jgi:hypothetical protein
MQSKVVCTKGIDWIVGGDGSISVGPHRIDQVRVRDGKEQRFSTNFKGGTLSPCKTKSGYLEVATSRNGKRVKELVHRLVGLAFVPGFESGLTINHINGIKTDNRPENLEWVSLARNTQHQWEIGLVDLRGEKQPGHKLTTKQVVYIRRLLSQGIPAHTLSVIAGVSSSLIDMIGRGKRWSHVEG